MGCWGMNPPFSGEENKNESIHCLKSMVFFLSYWGFCDVKVSNVAFRRSWFVSSIKSACGRRRRHRTSRKSLMQSTTASVFINFSWLTAKVSAVITSVILHLTSSVQRGCRHLNELTPRRWPLTQSSSSAVHCSWTCSINKPFVHYSEWVTPLNAANQINDNENEYSWNKSMANDAATERRRKQEKKEWAGPVVTSREPAPPISKENSVERDRSKETPRRKTATKHRDNVVWADWKLVR